MKTNIYIYDHTSLIVLRMRNVSSKSSRGNRKETRYFQKHLFRRLCLYEIMWKNLVEPGRPQMTIWRMRITCCILKATNTHSEYITLIAFPLQQWLHEDAYVIPIIPVLFLLRISPLYILQFPHCTFLKFPTVHS